MTFKKNTFESGLADGTALSTLNSGFPDAFNEVQLTTTGTVKYSTAMVHAGTRAARVQGGASGGKANMRWDLVRTEWWSRFYIGLPATWPIVTRIFGAFDIADDRMCSIDVRAAQDVRLLDNADLSRDTSAVLLPLSAWSRIETHIIHDPLVGLFEAQIFTNPAGTTPDDTLQAANIDTGGASALAYMRLGTLIGGAGGAVNGDVHFDDIAWSDAGWIGPNDPVAGGSVDFVGMVPV